MGANPNPKNIPFNFTKLNKYNEPKLFVLELMKKDLKNVYLLSDLYLIVLN